MQLLINLLNILSDLAIILGIPLGLYEFFRSSRKEQQDREEAVYHALDEGYMDFQRLCLQYPYLDIFDVPDGVSNILTVQQQKEELIAFTMLLTIFERAYVMYNKPDSQILKGQWEGWKDYIYAYCRRENFRSAWELSGNTYDPRFQKFMAQALKKSDHTSHQKLRNHL